MEKIEKNDTDVLGTKEQTGKEKKRNRSKYYAKRKIRKTFRQKVQKSEKETEKETFGQKVQKSEKKSEKETLGQKVQKSDVKNPSSTFGQNVLKSAKTKEEERKHRNKKRVRKENEKRKQKEKTSIGEENNLWEKRTVEEMESVDANFTFGQNVLKSDAKIQEQTLGQKVQKSEEETEKETLGQKVQKSEGKNQRETFGQNVLKSEETKEEERKSRNKKRVRKENEKRKQKEKTVSGEENNLWESSDSIFQEKRVIEFSFTEEDGKQKADKSHSSGIKGKRTEEEMVSVDANFTLGQNVLKSDAKIQEQTLGQKVQKSEEETEKETLGQKVQKSEGKNQRETLGQKVQKLDVKNPSETLGQNVSKSEESKEEERKSQNKKRVRKESEKRKQKEKTVRVEENNIWKNGETIFQEKRTIEFSSMEEDGKQKADKSYSSKIGEKRTVEEMAPADANFALGQNVQKSDEKNPSSTFGHKVQKSEKTGEKERKSGKKEQKEKFRADTEYTLEQIFDEKNGRTRYVAVPVKRKKLFHGDVVIKSTIQTAKRAAMDYVREQTEEEEDENENAATQSMYQAQKNAERVFALKKGNQVFHKTGNKGNYSFTDGNSENIKRKQEPESYKEKEQKKAFQKRMQKQKQKREYVKAIRKAVTERNLSEVILQTRNYTIMVASRMQKETVKHAGVLVTLGTALLLVVMIMTSISSCGAVFADMQSVILSAAYQSKPKEIDATDLQFTRKELELRNEIDNIERNYRGYDEYVYHLGSIGHNPFTLVSYLSAVYEEFQAEDVKREVDSLFGEMYRLTLQPVTEIRTRNVPVRDEYGDLVYDEYGNLETIEQDYEVHILKVILNVTALENIVSGKMNTEQKEFYELYHETGGLLQVFDSPLEEKWHSHISSFYGYRKNPISGAEQIHRGVDIAIPTGTRVYATHDGTVTEAGYSNSYGNYVVMEQDGYVTKYAHMDSLSVSAGQFIEKNTVIGASGNTGNSTGSHLHIECMYNGEYYNPLFYFENGM